MLAHIRERRKTGSDSTAFRESGVENHHETDYNSFRPATAPPFPGCEFSSGRALLFLIMADPIQAQHIQDLKIIFVHSAVDDLGLTAPEFRVYAHLARRAGGGEAWPAVASIAAKCRLHPDTVAKCLKQLHKYGMISKKDNPGHPCIYTITSMKKWRIEIPETEGYPKRRVTHPPETEGDRVGETEGDEVYPVKGIQKKELQFSPDGECEVNGKETGTGKKSASDQRLDPQRKRGAPSGSQPPSSAQPPSLNDLALEVYALYPRKVGRPDAIKAILRCFKESIPDVVKAKTKEFSELWARATPDELQYCPHPSTWFNQRRYEDDIQLQGPRRDRAKELKDLHERLKKHPANPGSIYHNENATPEQKKDFKDGSERYRALGGTEDL